MPSTKYKYAYGLLANARIFAESTVDFAGEDRDEHWKFAVLHLATAIELLLKACLALKDHRSLVRGKVQVTDRQFDLGEFHSIGTDECVEKLRARGASLSGRQSAAITRLRNLRNRVAHYISVDNTNQMKAAIAAGLNVFIEINNAHFPDEDPYRARTMSQLIVDLNEYDEFVTERLMYLSDQLRSATRPRTHHTDECPRCFQDATIIVNDKIQCLFCGDGVTVKEFAENISEDHSVSVCGDCGREAVARHKYEDDEPTYECFCCGRFTGPEPQWSNGEIPIPRLHPHRR